MLRQIFILPKDHTQPEAKKMCNKSSRSFQLSNLEENMSLVVIHTVECVWTPTVALRD